MAFVPIRADESKYSAVDGKTVLSDGVTADFDPAIVANKGGLGVEYTVKGITVTEILDAMPLGRQSVVDAVNNGTADLLADEPGPSTAGFADLGVTLVTGDANVELVAEGGGSGGGGGGGGTPTAGPEATLSSLFTITTATNSGDTVVTITPTDYTGTSFAIDDTTNFAVNAGGIVTTAQVLSVGSYPFTVTLTIVGGTYAGVYTYSWTLEVTS